MSAALAELLPEYERELAGLRRSLGEFARRYPNAAARLALSGEYSEDPHVERWVQSAALLCARASARIADDYPELPSALLETLYPEYLRPLPACTIAQFHGSAAAAKLTTPFVVQRGTELKTVVGEYRFQWVYDVVIAPLRITGAGYAPVTSAPLSIRLAQETTGMLSIAFEALAGSFKTGGSMPPSVRLFVDGDRRTVAAAIDALLLRATNAFVEADENGKWIALDAVPLACAGFEPCDALIQRRDESQPQFRVLLEYFSFPEKFAFIDIDLSMLWRAAGACLRMTLHVQIQDLHAGSASARALQGLGASNFKLFCAPVINLFKAVSEPITLEDAAVPVFPLVPGTLNASNTSVYRVDAVRLTRDRGGRTGVEGIESFHCIAHHAKQRAPKRYWIAERDGRLADSVPGQDMLLCLVDDSGQIVRPDAKQIDADLTCTNGNLPATLQVGEPHGDLMHVDQILTGTVSMLRSPTESAVRVGVRPRLWDLVAMLCAGAPTLCQAGLPAFKRLLSAHAPSPSVSAARHIDSLMHLAREPALEWMPLDPEPMLVRGIRVRLGVDETLLDDCAVSLFARAIESVLRYYAPANSFVQLVVISARSGATLFDGRALPGSIALI